MGYTLRFDEMLEAARASKMPQAEVWIAAAEAQTTLLSMALAHHLNMECGAAANLDLAILGNWFGPTMFEQDIPEAIKGFDDPDEWDANTLSASKQE